MEVRIRPYRATDAAAMAVAARESSPEMYPWLPWCHAAFSAEEAHAWIERKREDWRLRREFNFSILDGAGAFLGSCAINQIHPHYPLANVGYWVRTSATRRGVASAAVAQTVEFARRQTDLVRLEILVAAGNEASMRVAEKAGALLEGRLRARLVLHGTPRDAHLYSLVIDRRAPAAGDPTSAAAAAGSET